MKQSKTYFERMIVKGRDLAARTSHKIRPRKHDNALDKLSNYSTTLLTARGQSSGIKVATEFLNTYNQCNTDEKRAFFNFLLNEFGRDKNELIKITRAYSEQPDHDNLKKLALAMDPKRQELFKRINMAPGGTRALVEMRADLLTFLKLHPELKPVDLDFLLLFKTWFNRGFLSMEPVTWTSPALILEHLIAYEAVHEITSWTDLKSRLDPPDRLCFAFFHPNLDNNPLIFVEVALCEKIPSSIQNILSPIREITPQNQAKVATFYSINNCMTGLKGIYFGNFLIKQVVENLRGSHPGLKQFVTLSPIPGFKDWLNKDGQAEKMDISAADLEQLNTSDWIRDQAFSDRMKKTLRPAALSYLLDRQTGSHRLQNSVARFHLGNGARIESLQWHADTSEHGLENAYGLMVNYLYELDEIEYNHEAFAVRHEVALSEAMRSLKKKTTNK